MTSTLRTDTQRINVACGKKIVILVILKLFMMITFLLPDISEFRFAYFTSF